MRSDHHAGWRKKAAWRCLPTITGLRRSTPIPAALEDAVAAFDYLLAAGLYGQRDIVVCGDSAGGGLTLALALLLREPGPGPLPAAWCAVISPWTDLTESAGFPLSATRRCDPLISSEELREDGGCSMPGTEELNTSLICPPFTGITPVSRPC